MYDDISEQNAKRHIDECYADIVKQIFGEDDNYLPMLYGVKFDKDNHRAVVVAAYFLNYLHTYNKDVRDEKR